MDSLPLRRFAQLRAGNPWISDTTLLNSNNRTEFTGKADVVVAGAGILGLSYAIRLKKISPDLKIVVLEKSPAPVQKIGESTLAQFSRFVNDAVLPDDYLLRIFALKDGLQFYCLDEKDEAVTSEDIGGAQLSFQLDRRMSELLFTMWAQKMGIEVYHGVNVDFDVAENLDVHQTSFPASKGAAMNPLRAPRVVLKSFPQSQWSGTLVDPLLVCDATGFQRKLTSKFGKREAFGTWNCDAYWAYFKKRDPSIADSRLEGWDYPATNHICFPEGWGWFIELMSWHHAPLANLMDLVAYIIDCASNGVPACDLPCTQDLSDMFECPFEYVTSIGWAVRNDYKFPQNIEDYGATDSEQKFHYFQRKYPALDRLMTDVYELLPNYYGPRTYFVKRSLAYRSPVVAGNGWFAVGNSAGFTNPLISPGINNGMGGVYLAAALSKELLDEPLRRVRALMTKNAAIYQRYSHDTLMPRLDQINRYWYNLFRDHRLFDALIKCFWPLGITDVNTLAADYSTDGELNWILGFGNDTLVKFITDVLAVLESSDEVLDQPTVSQIEALSRQCLLSYNEQYPASKWGRFFRKYNNQVEKIPGKRERDRHYAYVRAVRCLGCKQFIHNKTPACPVCGTRLVLEEASGTL
ncbi:hypothetical protein MMC10_006407 [Thelotrema lepadinum]|nr:hypothetical protein [Thelotrema lepadinum]